MNYQKMIDYNQHMLNKMSKAHGFVMKHCLDPDRDDQNSEYNASSIVFEVMTREVVQSSVELNAYRDAMHTVRYPLIEQHRRDRAQRELNEKVAVASSLKELI